MSGCPPPIGALLDGALTVDSPFQLAFSGNVCQATGLIVTLTSPSVTTTACSPSLRSARGMRQVVPWVLDSRYAVQWVQEHVRHKIKLRRHVWTFKVCHIGFDRVCAAGSCRPALASLAHPTSASCRALASRELPSEASGLF
jgi:hypothetical protein